MLYLQWYYLRKSEWSIPREPSTWSHSWNCRECWIQASWSHFMNYGWRLMLLKYFNNVYYWQIWDFLILSSFKHTISSLQTNRFLNFWTRLSYWHNYPIALRKPKKQNCGKVLSPVWKQCMSISNNREASGLLEYFVFIPPWYQKQQLDHQF